MTDECPELKNIKYQTMLLNSHGEIDSTKRTTENIDDYLQKEKALSKDKPWNKLGKASKLRKISTFVTQYTSEQGLTNKQAIVLHRYLNACLEKKKLQRVKDVVYDSVAGKISSIPGLAMNKTANKFTLRRQDKKRSTLKGLAPKRRKNGGKSRKRRSKIDIHLNPKAEE